MRGPTPEPEDHLLYHLPIQLVVEGYLLALSILPLLYFVLRRRPLDFRLVCVRKLVVNTVIEVDVVELLVLSVDRPRLHSVLQHSLVRQQLFEVKRAQNAAHLLLLVRRVERTEDDALR